MRTPWSNLDLWDSSLSPTVLWTGCLILLVSPNCPLLLLTTNKVCGDQASLWWFCPLTPGIELGETPAWTLVTGKVSAVSDQAWGWLCNLSSFGRKFLCWYPPAMAPLYFSRYFCLYNNKFYFLVGKIDQRRMGRPCLVPSSSWFLSTTWCVFPSK